MTDINKLRELALAALGPVSSNSYEAWAKMKDMLTPKVGLDLLDRLDKAERRAEVLTQATAALLHRAESVEYELKMCKDENRGLIESLNQLNVAYTKAYKDNEDSKEQVQRLWHALSSPNHK